MVVLPDLSQRGAARVPLPRLGGEDEAWGTAVHTIAGYPWRGLLPLFHLRHLPQQRINRHIGSGPSNELWVRYTYAAGVRRTSRWRQTSTHQIPRQWERLRDRVELAVDSSSGCPTESNSPQPA
ncbi:hypothetical protein Ais01nite_21720 [Asanoa ishikariensis]|uniref:hypothetical protein n=1 Tax=Asanoa ishikariensis TaxID=137265 RepID=UPI00115FE20A|nr:hypothetical protein [Asanoa ishikariensis]GIF64137.1 hypothetical protein Ais01nite_21720 [Asanoa ishikariensis]